MYVERPCQHEDIFNKRIDREESSVVQGFEIDRAMHGTKNMVELFLNRYHYLSSAIGDAELWRLVLIA
jgi:hypothetical protein